MNKTCFVVIGFGPKTDYRTGRVIDLDKTYENLIKPVFDKLDIECFRAKEIKHSGIIDVPMYKWLLDADIVVADISTLNPNALYELGVRHALRPNTTIVISEDQLEYPFDINHTVIEPYEHLGKDIGVTEAKRFQGELESKVMEILDNSSTDSPVYTYIPNLVPPSLAEKDVLEDNHDNDDIQPSVVKFSELLEDAEKLKNAGEFSVAKELYLACLDFEPGSDFLIQRLALVTYKSGLPSVVDALHEAEKILEKLKPLETTDPETLGLSGAIQKRLFESTNDEDSLDLSMTYYEKGFVLLNDYYNGFNYAFLLLVKSGLQENYSKKSEYIAAAHLAFNRVLNICTKILEGESARNRDDILWIQQTLCLCYLGLNKRELYDKARVEVVSLSKGEFDLNTFVEHENAIIDLLS